MSNSNSLSEHLEEHLESGFSPEEKEQILEASRTGQILFSDDDPGSPDWSRSDPDAEQRAAPPPPPRREPPPAPPRDTRSKHQVEWENDVHDLEMAVPDVIPALEHYSRSRRAELASLNGPAEAEAALGAEVARIIEHARGRGENPAEYFYKLAKVRGYAGT